MIWRASAAHPDRPVVDRHDQVQPRGRSGPCSDQCVLHYDSPHRVPIVSGVTEDDLQKDLTMPLDRGLHVLLRDLAPPIS